mgnify:CR=1 FL=1
MKRIYASEERCMGCGLCEVYCTQEHSRSKDLVKAYRGEVPKPFSRVRVERDKPVSFAVQCHQCTDAPCLIACLSGAMHVDERTGLLSHDAEKCIGCWTCIMVCPYGAVKVDSQVGEVVAKCDLCPDLKIPACVANCPNEALTLREVSV